MAFSNNLKDHKVCEIGPNVFDTEGKEEARYLLTDKVHKIIKYHAKYKIITNIEVELETNWGNGNGGNKTKL